MEYPARAGEDAAETAGDKTGPGASCSRLWNNSSLILAFSFGLGYGGVWCLGRQETGFNGVRVRMAGLGGTVHAMRDVS